MESEKKKDVRLKIKENHEKSHIKKHARKSHFLHAVSNRKKVGYFDL